MTLTNEIVESKGFKRINNSMWRLGAFTLQNGYKNDGGILYNKILTTIKAYKVCWSGKYFMMISTIKELNKITEYATKSIK